MSSLNSEQSLSALDESLQLMPLKAGPAGPVTVLNMQILATSKCLK